MDVVLKKAQIFLITESLVFNIRDFQFIFKAGMINQ